MHSKQAHVRNTIQMVPCLCHRHKRCLRHFSDENARAFATNACLGHSSDKDMSGTCFKQGNVCALATSACPEYSSDMDMLVHPPQAHVWNTLETGKLVYSPQAHVRNISARKTCVFTTRAFFENAVGSLPLVRSLSVHYAIAHFRADSRELFQQSLPCLPWVWTSNRPDAFASMEAETPRQT